jgi:hypothetical protein
VKKDIFNTVVAANSNAARDIMCFCNQNIDALHGKMISLDEWEKVLSSGDKDEHRRAIRCLTKRLMSTGTIVLQTIYCNARKPGLANPSGLPFGVCDSLFAEFNSKLL